MGNFIFWCWMKRLGERIESAFPGQHSGWESWDDWKSYFDEGMTPRQAITESHRMH